MALTVLDFNDLSDFSGDDLAEYYTDDAYVDQVLQQASDLIELNIIDDISGLSDLQKRVLRYATLEVAQMFYFQQPHKRALLSPMQSETIGNYSYSKMAASAQTGDPTGLFWYDQLVQSQSGSTLTETHSTSVFENDGVWTDSEGNNRRILGPAELYPTGAGGQAYPAGAFSSGPD